MPRGLQRWLDRRRARHGDRMLPTAELAAPAHAEGQQSRDRAERALLALRWIADETRALVASGTLPVGAAGEVGRCGDATEAAAREIERVGASLREVHGDPTFP